MKQVAIYGKGGIGKSTVSSNLSAALSEKRIKVMQVGCDPKQDSTATLAGTFPPTVLDILQAHNVSFDINLSFNHQHESLIEECVLDGFNDVKCVESGGPKPGIGCAGRGVLVALEFLTKHKVFEKYDIDVVVYDVLGDVVCGGFAAPMRSGFAEEVYLVTSGELMALYAANNIAKAIQKLAHEKRNTRVAGIINNQRNVVGEVDLVEDFADRLGVPLIAHIPRSDYVQQAEIFGKTVIEAFPESIQAQMYRDLAEKILDNQVRVIPDPLPEIQDLQELIRKHHVQVA